MKKTKFKVILSALAIILLAAACKQYPANKSRLEEINLVNAYQRKNEVKLSALADSVEYIRLENKAGYFIEDPVLVNVSDSLVIVMEFNRICVFERKSGRFLREVSSFGKGPDQHGRVRMYDELNQLFFANDGNSYKIENVYNLTGRIVKRFNIPESEFDNDKMFSITSFSSLSENEFLGYTPNLTGKSNDRLIVFNTSGTILKRYPNFNKIDTKKFGEMKNYFFQGWFFNYSDTTRFLELYTDTIFTIRHDKIVPRFFLQMGEFNPPNYINTKSWDEGSELLRYFSIHNMQESSRYLIFTLGYNGFRHLSYYDKKEKNATVCDNNDDKEYYRYTDYWEKRNIGLLNDIDNFIPIATGKDELFISRNNNLITYIDASDVERWFRMNPGKALKLPEILKKFSNVKAMDNIIVEVVHLKK